MGDLKSNALPYCRPYSGIEQVLIVLQPNGLVIFYTTELRVLISGPPGVHRCMVQHGDRKQPSQQGRESTLRLICFLFYYERLQVVVGIDICMGSSETKRTYVIDWQR